ncbi:MAG: hypothetical protein K2X66_15820, partial [Cyanobacteria bacterium]|nr:hypothetical protein [Cyanobacteriota bacterium]
ILDNTQAFFSPPIADGWTFYSARKFFGVPDGAYLYPPVFQRSSPETPEKFLHLLSGPGPMLPYNHLFLKKTFYKEEAYEAFKNNEAQQSIHPSSPSRMSQNIMAHLNYDQIKRKRLENYEFYRQQLNPINACPIDAITQRIGPPENSIPNKESIPFFYLFTPRDASQNKTTLSQDLEQTHSYRQALAHRGIYTPCFWPEVFKREGSMFNWEKKSTCWMFPLPIDHRYDQKELIRVVEGIRQVFPEPKSL